MAPYARLPFALSSAGIFAILALALFGDVLLAGQSLVLSTVGTDIVTYFLPLREFGFRELRAGNFPLWDPYTYSGTPYAANFKAALFYPPTWLHLVLPATMLRAVPLAAGRHHLLFRYEQPGLLLGAILTLSSLGLLMGAALVTRRAGLPRATRQATSPGR